MCWSMTNEDLFCILVTCLPCTKDSVVVVTGVTAGVDVTAIRITNVAISETTYKFNLQGNDGSSVNNILWSATKLRHTSRLL